MILVWAKVTEMALVIAGKKLLFYFFENILEFFVFECVSTNLNKSQILKNVTEL